MNGSKSPDPAITKTGPAAQNDRRTEHANGNRELNQRDDIREANDGLAALGAPTREEPAALDAGTLKEAQEEAENDAPHDDVDSEAETLIDSPVKRKEAERKNNVVKLERQQPKPRHRIGSLPVPTDGDDDDSAQPSPVPSVENAASAKDVKNESLKHAKDEGDRNSMSEPLSSPRSSASNPPSRESSLARALSELPEFSSNIALSPNPRKRKHRASSVSLPNKRPSNEPSRRRIRGLHSEELDARKESSLSPKLRSHRRAASTQSAFTEGVPEVPDKKRRSAPHGLGKELKGGRPLWEESDTSSETTSHGNTESRRPRRGVGRSTSTPGRPAGREHKRHINKYGFTRLAEACEEGDLDRVKEWRNRDPDQLELAEFAGNKPLQIAALHGNVEVVDYLIEQGCQIDCANVDKDTPLIDAAENGHLDVLRSLLRAGVDPLRQNLKGQQALDVVTDDTDDADEIRAALRNAIEAWNTNGSRQRREEEEEMRHRAGPTKELHFMARSYENLLKLVQINDRNGVKEFLDARVPVDNAIIAAAAKTGDSYLVNMLLAEMSEKKASQRPERLMLSVLGTSHLEMVKSLSELDNFDPLYRNRQDKTWPELAEERHGPNWREEKQLLQRLYDQSAASKERCSSSPVSKRDSAKRRVVRRTPAGDEAGEEGEGEDSDEDQAPRRKNGRRLMSKRDMRVASGRAPSHESSGVSSSDDATGTGNEREEGASTRTPSNAADARGSGSKNRTSSSTTPNVDKSPRLRRQSSLLRATNERPLQALEEVAEDKDTAAPSETSEMHAANEAQLAEMKRIQDREAEAAAAAERAEAEKARLAEEERRAEQARREEEARAAEEERRAEEERARVKQEMAAAKLRYLEQVAISLPIAISHVLHPASAFSFDNDAALDYLIQYFTPLQVLKQEHQDASAALPAGADAPHWIINMQAAPLVGKQGIELMLPKSAPGYEASLANTWATKDVLDTDQDLIGSVLANLPQHLPPGQVLDSDLHSRLSFEEDVQRAADRMNAVAEMRARLRDGQAVLRYVRLDEVLKNLHPKLRDLPIDVRYDYMPVSIPSRGISRVESGNFVTNLNAVMDARPRQQTFVDGEGVNDISSPPRRLTPVSIAHQKSGSK